MSDIFISYARSTAKQAQRVAEALRAHGYSVWIDDDLPAHRTYSRVIEEQMAAALAAVVIWSADAVQSEWVMSEANRAREDRKLVQVITDASRLPMPFDTIQCADLAGWSGDLDAPAWRKVVGSVADLVGGARLPARRPADIAAATNPAQPLLAVLAFDNLSGDPEMAYFSDGVSEEIQQTVARGTDLKVIGRTSSFQFRGADKAVRKVVADLRATHILDGSVRRSGSRVRISAQLIECAGETALWSDRFDRDLADIFALQDEIANAVAEALKAAFKPPPPTGSIDPATYELYLRALRFGLGDDLSRSGRTPLAEQVTKAAPKFAPGWALLAYSQAWQLLYGGSHDDFAVKRAQAFRTVETALTIDPSAGIAYLARELLEPWGCYAEREAILSEAITVAPNEPLCLTEFGRLCMILGRFREGLPFLERAYELDPLSAGVCSWHATTLGVLGRNDQEERLELELLDRFPDEEFWGPLFLSGPAFRNDWPMFDRLAAAIRERGIKNPRAQRSLDQLLAMRNPTDEVRRVTLEWQRSVVDRTGTADLTYLFALNSMGMKEEAWDLIDRISFDRFDGRIVGPAGTLAPSFLFRISGAMDMPLDPRFVGLCAKLGLCDYWIASGKWPDMADQVPYDFRAEARRLAASTKA